MSRLEDLMIAAILLLALLLGTWYGAHHYGSTRYDAGYAAAIAAGQVQHAKDVDQARKTEADLRAQLRDHDEDAHVKEQAYAVSLEVAQRRVLTGADRLRCPTASPVQPAAATSDRPTTPGPAPDGTGAELVPEAAADLLGDAAAVAGLVRKFDRLEQRFEACRAVNAQ